MEISRNELINILDSIGLEYELDSNNPGIVTEEKTFYSYSDLDLPIDFEEMTQVLSENHEQNKSAHKRLAPIIAQKEKLFRENF